MPQHKAHPEQTGLKPSTNSSSILRSNLTEGARKKQEMRKKQGDRAKRGERRQRKRKGEKRSKAT
jgi:hypothetical protein